MAIPSTFKEQVAADKLRRFANSVSVLHQKPYYIKSPDHVFKMPAVFRQSNLPLTPPEYFPTYAGCGAIQMNALQFGVSHQGMSVHEKAAFNKSTYGGHETYGAYQYSQDQYTSGMSRLIPSAGIPPPSAIPTELPALIEDVPRQNRQDSKRHETVEDKSVGGVSAHLDYEMDEMVEFVATVAQNMFVLGPRFFTTKCPH